MSNSIHVQEDGKLYLPVSLKEQTINIIELLNGDIQFLEAYSDGYSAKGNGVKEAIQRFKSILIKNGIKQSEADEAATKGVYRFCKNHSLHLTFTSNRIIYPDKPQVW